MGESRIIGGCIMKKRRIRTRENNFMSLSCVGEMLIEGNTVVSVSFSGMPRTYGDGWVNFYQNAYEGKRVSDEDIERVLSYHGKNNVSSRIEEVA